MGFPVGYVYIMLKRQEALTPTAHGTQRHLRPARAEERKNVNAPAERQRAVRHRRSVITMVHGLL